MSATATAILGLAAWTVVLLFALAGFRMWASFARKGGICDNGASEGKEWSDNAIEFIVAC